MKSEEYFSDLNYTLANEDTTIEYSLLEENSSRVFAIAGSGARVLPLLAKNPNQLDVVDLSVAQLFLCELRVQAVKALNYDEFLFFMGYRGGLPNSNQREDLRTELFGRIELSPECRTFWDNKSEIWTSRGFIYCGKWEGHFKKIGKLFRDYLLCDFSPMFKAQTLENQIKAYEKHWPNLRFKAFTRSVVNDYIFNKYLYKGHFPKSQKSDENSKPIYRKIEDEFERLFTTTLVRKNFFLQSLLLGSILYEEGLPFEANYEIFKKIKSSRTKISYLSGNMLKYLSDNSYSFISLSDTISYLPLTDAQNILQIINKAADLKTRIVIRSFMRSPEGIITTGWKIMADQEDKAQKSDCTFVYRFHIYEKE